MESSEMVAKSPKGNLPKCYTCSSHRSPGNDGLHKAMRPLYTKATFSRYLGSHSLSILDSALRSFVMSTCTTIDSNPDVSGIGVRFNLYVTIFLLAGIPRTKSTKKLRHALISNARISGLALLITAIVQTARGTLFLYHAIFIHHILYFIGILIISPGNYKQDEEDEKDEDSEGRASRRKITCIMTYGSTLLYAGYATSVWAKAPTFGTNPRCNNQIQYIFFFKSISATTPWLRKLMMALMCATFGPIILVPIFLPCCQKSSTDFVNSWAKKVPASVPTIICVLGVVMLELYVKRNQRLITPGENRFTFGQIFAIVQIIDTFNELLHFFYENRFRLLELVAHPSRLLPWNKGSHDHARSQDVKETNADATNV